MNVPDFPPRLDTDLVKPFWTALEQGTLRLPACSVCGAWQWYPYEFVRCHPEATLQWREVRGRGTVFSFTRVTRNFLPVETAVPYVCALVEPDEAPGVRIASVLDTDSGEPSIGMRVRLKPTPRSNYTAPVFEPATDGE